MGRDSTWGEDKWTVAAEKLALLSEPVPLEVVHILTERSSVGLSELCRTLHLPKEYALHHLAELEQAGIVQQCGEDGKPCYAIADEKIKKVVDILFGN
ncbi:ArsR/SmtB family transcription factor [Ectobacillus ponti]|uniref:Helix-turn-helix domain-containing protein n=1 Tax=Ectobacillus ponti TaxID=2961894 RepID=A0AA41X8U9_9BACI|nr:helix-turn-helix domain-containing protein [Ectobacillus ponti]MCP8970852.1 helix-turn-helix domain-containing protein [Ectobacillus ponti]